MTALVTTHEPPSTVLALVVLFMASPSARLIAAGLPEYSPPKARNKVKRKAQRRHSKYRNKTKTVE